MLPENRHGETKDGTVHIQWDVVPFPAGPQCNSLLVCKGVTFTRKTQSRVLKRLLFHFGSFVPSKLQVNGCINFILVGCGIKANGKLGLFSRSFLS